MEAANKPDISAIFRDGTAMDRAVTRAARQAIRRHKLLGESIVVWQDGRTVVIPAEEIPEDWTREPPDA